MSSHPNVSPNSADLLTRPLMAVVWWGLPLLTGWTADALPIAPPVQSLIWAAALAWMGAGCVLNAVRCQRLHCYLAAPILFLGALATAAAALGLDPLGRHTASYAINASLLLALLTFAVEPIWGRYRPR